MYTFLHNTGVYLCFMSLIQVGLYDAVYGLKSLYPKIGYLISTRAYMRSAHKWMLMTTSSTSLFIPWVIITKVNACAHDRELVWIKHQVNRPLKHNVWCRIWHWLFVSLQILSFISPKILHFYSKEEEKNEINKYYREASYWGQYLL